MGERPSGKELIQRVPTHKQKWQVSEADLQKISTLIRAEWWERFARKIGFNNEVEEIKQQYRSLDSRRYQLLLQWSNRYRQKATYRIILLAFSELNQIDALDAVCQFLRAQSKPGPPLPSEIDEYSVKLKQEYSSYRISAIVDWPPPPTENFIKLAMIREEGVRRGEIDPQFVSDMTQGNVANVLHKKVKIRPEEIFDTIKLPGGKVILVEGAPGSGKTTLCWYICQQWGKGLHFQQFSHVLMVELRDRYIQEATCIADMLPFCEEREGSRIAGQMGEDKRENVLIILEGWDQLPESLRQNSLFQQLIKKKAHHCPLRQAVVLISSRSSVTADLHSCVDMRIETLGFTTDQIERYVRTSFGEERERAENLLNKIRQNPRLEGNCYLPLILMLIVHLYSDGYQLPETFCGVVIELALTCLYRYRRNILKKDKVDVNSFDMLPEDIRCHFFYLCKLAYKATMEERYSFSNLETENLLGLMQTVESLSRRKSRTTQYFLHSSLQELCAAVHISQHPISTQKDLLKEVLDHRKDYVLRFYSALTHWKDDDMVDVLLENSKKICEEVQSVATLPPKPEVLSESLAPMIYQLKKFPSKFTQYMEYIINVAVGKKPFDRDELASLLDLGSVHVANELSTVTEDMLMKLSDASFNPDDRPLWLNETLEKAAKGMMKGFSQEVTEQGIDTNVKTFGLTMLEHHMALQLPLFQNWEQIAKEIFEAFGTTDIPEEVIHEQMVQKMQQEVMKRQPTEDPQLKMGIPIPSEQQVSHSTHNVFVHSSKQWAANGSLADLAKLQLTGDPNMHKKCMELVKKNLQCTTTSHQQLLAYILHKEETYNMLMLIHCIYESKNPKLIQVLGPSLVLLGELNTSDIIALQSVLCMKESGKCYCKLETLRLLSAISEMRRVVEVIKATSTIHTLALSVGHYDEDLVRAVLQKPHIKRFNYDWVIENEIGHTHSCESLALGLKHNQSLQILDISGVQTLDLGVELLAGVLNTTRLAELHLSRCGVEERGIKALSTALATNVYLNVLHLNDTTISPTALKHISISLRHNNTLKVLGLVEDPMTTELSEEDFKEFIMQLRFNSSITYILLNGLRIHSPTIQQALTVVNLVRKLKLQPQLSVDDHYPKSYIPEIYNDLRIQGFQANSIGPMPAWKLNIPCLTRNVESFLMKEMPVPVWTQTFTFSLQFIREMKKVRNLSMCHLMPKTILINTHSQRCKATYLSASMYAQHQTLPYQVQQQTLCHALQVIQKTKAMRNLSMRHLLCQRSPRIQINGHTPTNTHFFYTLRLINTYIFVDIDIISLQYCR